MAAPAYYTADMVRAFPDDGVRYETVHGELFVTPAPSAPHQEVLGRLVVALNAYLQRELVGHLFFSPADISWGPDILVQPDLFVVALDEARTMDWSRMKSLRLAVEVLSPTTARRDRFTKRVLYQQAGVESYWVVDLDAQAVEMWTPEALKPETVTGTLTWRPEGAAEPLVMVLEDLFRPI